MRISSLIPLLVVSVLAEVTPASAQSATELVEDLPLDPRVWSQLDLSGQATPRALFLPGGTPVCLELTDSISTRTSKRNDQVRFRVVSEVLLDGLTIIPKGAEAWGIVTLAKKPHTFSRDGKLEIAPQSVTLLNGQTVAICSPAICKRCGKWDWHAPDSLQAPLLGVLAPVIVVMMPKEDRPAVLGSMVSKGNHVEHLPGTSMAAVVSGKVELDREEFFSLQPLTVGKEHE